MSIARIVVTFVVLCAPQLVSAQEPTILKHDGWVAAVAFAPDGKALASAGSDNVVRLWEVGTWKAKGVLQGHTDCVCAVVFSPDHKLLATGSFDRTAKLWHVDEKGERRTFTEHEGAVLSVIFDKDLKRLITGGVDARIVLRSVKTLGRDVYRRHRSWVNALARDPEYTCIASGSSDGTVHLFNMKDSAIMLEGGAGEVRCVAFSPDGKTLAAGNRYGTVRVWDVATRKELRTITGHMGEVWAIAFSPDGTTLAAVDTEWRKPSKIKLYDTATWKERGSLPCPGEILCLAYSPKGDWLAAGSWDKTVRLFAIEQKP